jgi:glycosyltransferase involved in cell wall biosynthesis
MRIWGWASDHGGCGQYRLGLPMWALNASGHEASAFSRLNTDLPDDLDVLVGQRICAPSSTRFWLDLAADPGRRTTLVYEIDDDLWNIHGTNTAALALRRPEVLANVEACLAAADAVTVTNEHLAAIVAKYNPNVHVLPNCVDATWLTHERPRAERVTVGWAGGSSHANDFASVRSELRAFLRRNPEVDAHFIGANHGPTVGRPDARHSGWKANLVEYLYTIDFDLGIAPLAAHVFNRSKSDLKVLEYATLGIPVVASDYGPYSSSVQHGVTGLLVKYPHEWGKYLRLLVNDDAMRAQMGENARRWAATRTIQANVWRWEAAYTNAVLGRRTAAASV